jgi:DnaJ domain
MADGALSIKLRCASWQQLATIYRRDLSQGTMFLKAATPPAVGTQVQIDLTLPSATVIALAGVVHGHLTDPQRGSGIEVRLAPIPAGSVWLIESALASESRRLATPVQGIPVSAAHHMMTGVIPTITEASDVAEAERDLIKALVSEAESLKKLNPFLVLGVGYEATDAEIRAAFGELTKRYHPDRFARYESGELREVAAEIFILIRDAYRRLADAASRVQLLHSLGKPAPAPRALPGPRAAPPVPSSRATQRVPLALAQTAAIATVPPPIGSTAPAGSSPGAPAPGVPATPGPGAPASARPAAPGGSGAPPAPGAPAAILPSSVVVVPPARPPTTPPATQPTGRRPGQERPSSPPGNAPASGDPSRPSSQGPSSHHGPSSPSGRRATTEGAAPLPPPPLPPAPRAGTGPAAPAGEPPDPSALEDLIDHGRLDEALAGFRLMAKKHPHDRNVRAGIELCEGLRALAARDRLEAAQRFEAALEIDPSNERAARELAEMRRQATNERKGLLSRLMGKKEP